MPDVMVDLETLATTPNTVVLTLGAIKFNPKTKEEPFDPIYLRLTIDDQTEQYNRFIDPATIEWWGNQDQAVQDEAFGEEDRVSMSEAIDQFHKWCWGSNAIWANGSIFDVAILEHMYRQLERVPAWNYYNIKDVRTMFGLGIAHGMDKADLHNALADAYQQAKGIQNVYAELDLGE